MNEKLIQKYAHLAVKTGANVQEGQLLVITSPVHTAYFARACAQEAYKLGAKEVIVEYSDELLSRIHMLNADTDVLCDVAQWQIDRHKHSIDKKCAYLHIDSRIPDVLEGCDPQKLQAAMIARQKAFKPFRYYTMANHGQWSIVAVPNESWAKKMFPECDVEVAMEKCWDAILKSVYLDEDNDPIQAWIDHSATIHRHCKALNDFNFKSLHFKNEIGTDCVVELVPNHIWEGGSGETRSGVTFNANMPTEEVFSMPLRTGVNGTVVSTKPLNYQGKLVDDFKLTFKDGKVVEYSALQNYDALKNLIELDEGSCYLGEVALISHDSPISKSNILFYDTLFDENASCHLALGAAYPSNLKGGTDMSEEELKEAGANVSMTHIDFMFGSADMQIIGLTQEGTEVVVFKDGNFVI